MARPTWILFWVTAAMTAVVVASALLIDPGAPQLPDLPLPALEPTESRAAVEEVRLSGTTVADASTPEGPIGTRRPGARSTALVARGTVMGSGKVPIANAEVRVRCRLGSRLATFGPVHTDSEGRFSHDLAALAGLSPSEQRQFRLSGIAEAPGMQATAFKFKRKAGAARVWVGDVRLRAGVTLTGRIVDSAARPVARATVRLYTEAGKAASDVQRTHYTDDRGEFRVGARSVGASYLLAKKTDIGRAVVDIASQGSLVPRDLGDLVLYGSGRIAGRVIDREGRAVEGLRVKATSRLDRTRASKQGYASREARTGADGRFELRDIQVGPAHLEAPFLLRSQGDSPARSRAVHLRESGGSDKALYATGRTNLELVLPVHRLRVIVEDPSGQVTGSCRVLCVLERRLGQALASLTTRRSAVPAGDPPAVDYLVTPGEDLAVVAYATSSGQKRRNAVRLLAHETVRITESPQQRTVTLRLRRN